MNKTAVIEILLRFPGVKTFRDRREAGPRSKMSGKTIEHCVLHALQAIGYFRHIRLTASPRGHNKRNE